MQNIGMTNQQWIEEYATRTRALNQAAERVVQRLFGCWQHDLSRPFSHGGQAYRVCVKCGLARNFNINTFETYGASYALRATSVSPN